VNQPTVTLCPVGISFIGDNHAKSIYRWCGYLLRAGRLWGGEIELDERRLLFADNWFVAGVSGDKDKAE
jgi:hypothetical protein